MSDSGRSVEVRAEAIVTPSIDSRASGMMSFILLEDIAWLASCLDRTTERRGRETKDTTILKVGSRLMISDLDF
jgi:hypothetical protein